MRLIFAALFLFSFFSFSPPALLSPRRPSSFSYPELLDGRGGKWHFSLFFTCQPLHMRRRQLTHPVRALTVAPRRQSCELHFSQVADGKLCVFLRGGGSSDPALSPSHTALPDLRLISLFVQAPPPLWGGGEALRPTQKIGHPLALLSPPRRSENNPARCPLPFGNI